MNLGNMDAIKESALVFSTYKAPLYLGLLYSMKEKHQSVALILGTGLQASSFKGIRGKVLGNFQ